MSCKIDKITVVASLLSLLACQETSSESPGADVMTDKTSAVTYHKDIRPLIESKCLSCHDTGGIGSFTFTDYDSVKRTSAAITVAVETKSMPPWLPNKDCRHYVDERGMSDEEIALFSRWNEAGSPKGNISDYTPVSTSSLTFELPPPSMELKPLTSYTPRTEKPDDYRCFLLPQTFEQETFLQTSQIVPDVSEQAHHVIVYLVEPNLVDTVISMEESDDEPGYQCFGGIGVGNPQFLSGWAPGNKVQKIDPQVAMRIPAGSRLVMQMHYNTLNSTPKPDQTMIRLWLTEQKPDYLLTVNPFPHFGIEIDALDARSRHSRTFKNNSRDPWIVVATAPHMHLLGKEIKVTALHADGTQECIVDIDNWDFGWQQSYNFLPDEYVTIAPGDSVRVDCVYDNSAENQPVVNQTRLESQDVTWGDGTLDEMCLNYLVMIEPYFEAPDVQLACTEEFQPCYDQCKAGLFGTVTGCGLECSQAAGSTCGECIVTGLVTCGVETCPIETSAFLSCVETCGASNNPDCIRDECLNQILVFERCIEPLVAEGQCDAHLGMCMVEL